MKALLLPILAAALLIGGCAQSRSAATGPALWSVSDADSTVWLFGTVHVLRPDVEWKSAAVTEALTEAEAIYFEVDTRAAEAPGFVVEAFARGRNPPGVSLSDLLSSADKASLARAAQRLGLDPAQFEPLRPWLAALQLSVAALAAEGATAEAGVETVLEGRADALGLRRGYFETAEEQIGFLADLPTDVQLAFLAQTLRDVQDADSFMAEMDSAWATGDVAGLTRLVEEDLAETPPAVREAILYARNRRWADEIVALLATRDDVFVAVGAAHLVGEESVVDLLRARGLTVEGP